MPFYFLLHDAQYGHLAQLPSFFFKLKILKITIAIPSEIIKSARFIFFLSIFKPIWYTIVLKIHANPI